LNPPPTQPVRSHDQGTVVLPLAALALILVVGLATVAVLYEPPARPARVAAPAPVALRGAGATFPEPIYRVAFTWFAEDVPGASVAYDAAGSGKGIKEFTDGRVDFGATDAPMNDQELAAAVRDGGPVLHVPTVLGAVAVVYHLPEHRPPVRLDAELLAAINLGKITRWNDPAIAAQNPGQSLPGLRITTVHRADSSGTTANFTSFVAGRSPEFDSRIGAGKEVDWVGGVAAKGNGGVAEQVGRIEGAIGYVELNFAFRHGLPTAAIRNAAGRYVVPTVDSTAAAAADLAAVPGDFRATLVDAKAPGAYPIATWTFLVVRQQQASQARGTALVKLLWYLTHTAQPWAENLNYARLPAPAVQRTEAAIRSIRGPDGRSLYQGSQ
jgi:phosphate transport system substrate-binding protein